MLKILAVLLIIGVFVYVWYRNDLRRLTRDYACEEAFDGALEHCIVRFPVDEAGTDCMLGVNNDGLYMSSSIEALAKKRRWSFRYYVIRTPLWSLRRTCALMRRRTPRSHQRILAQRRNERRSAGSAARFGPKTGRSVACYASESAATPTTDAIHASAHCLLLLWPTLGNYFCRPRSCLRLPLPRLPTQDWECLWRPGAVPCERSNHQRSFEAVHSYRRCREPHSIQFLPNLRCDGALHDRRRRGAHCYPCRRIR
jgi:hypothetical protein